MMHIMAPIVHPFQPVLSRLMAFSVWIDTTKQTFDPRELLEQYPVAMTHMEDFIREHAKGKT
jgi:hypothetical protein